MSDKVYKFCLIIVAITIVIDIILLFLHFNINNIIGLIVSILLLIFVTLQYKKEENSLEQKESKIVYSKGGSGTYSAKISLPLSQLEKWDLQGKNVRL